MSSVPEDDVLPALFRWLMGVDPDPTDPDLRWAFINHPAKFGLMETIYDAGWAPLWVYAWDMENDLAARGPDLVPQQGGWGAQYLTDYDNWSGLAKTVANTPVGSRNNELFKAACKAAETFPDETDQWASDLTAAAEQTGLSRWEAVKTIRQALKRVATKMGGGA